MHRSIRGIKDMVASTRAKEENYNFTNSGGQKTIEPSLGSEGLNLNTKEKVLIDELIKKIEEQKREISQTNATLQTIQKNFESMSAMCKAEKTENIELKKKLESSSKQSGDLQASLKSANLRITELLERLVKFENDPEKDQLYRGFQQMKAELAKKDKLIEELSARCEKSEMEARDWSKQAKDIQSEKQRGSSDLNDLQALVAKLKTRITELDKMVENYEGRISSLKVKGLSKKSKITFLEEENEELKTRCQELSTQNSDLLVSLELFIPDQT